MVQPSAAAVQLVRIIPMKQRDEWCDARLEQAIDELLVKRKAALVRAADAIGNHARPADAEAIRAQADFFHQLDVVAPAVIVVARDLAGVTGKDRAILAAEHVPHAHAAAVFARGSFDLVRSGGGAPDETVRKHNANSDGFPV